LCGCLDHASGDRGAAVRSRWDICFSQTAAIGPGRVKVELARPRVDPRAVQPFPVFNPATGLVEKPEIPARKTFYRDIAVLAMPAEGPVARDRVIDLSTTMSAAGVLECELPAGNWTVYRFGHTTMGAPIQPAQWKATGLECNKMSEEAVRFHMNHVIGEIRKYLCDLIGTGFTHVHFEQRCQAMLQWGWIGPADDFAVETARGLDETPRAGHSLLLGHGALPDHLRRSGRHASGSGSRQPPGASAAQRPRSRGGLVRALERGVAPGIAQGQEQHPRVSIVREPTL